MGVEEYGANVRDVDVGEEALALMVYETLSARREFDKKTEGGGEEAKNCNMGIRFQHFRVDCGVVGISASFGYVSVKRDPAGCNTGDMNWALRTMSAEG